MPEFIKGMVLCEQFHSDVVAPLMEKHFPGLIYSAGRLGGGSDVLGFDTPRSRDHDWGPQMDMFLSPDDFSGIGTEIYSVLANTLPLQFKGYPTNFENGYLMKEEETHPIIHRVKVHTASSFFTSYVGCNPLDGFDEIQWLRTPQQILRTIRFGGVFHDGLGKLVPIKRALDWYPDGLWFYLLACQWVRIDQEEPFMARCGAVGDELGSRLVAARQIQEIIRLCFLMEKQYAPYTKWFGTAFSTLECADLLGPMLDAVLLQDNWKSREHALNDVYLVLAEMHNSLSITGHIEPEISHFHDRPYLVPHSSRFVEALMAKVESPRLKSLSRPIGAVDQFADSTDILCWPAAMKALSGVYDVSD